MELTSVGTRLFFTRPDREQKDTAKSAVISALLKYRTTEAMRDSVDDSFDIHGGRAIQDGPGNYLFGGYMATPVAIIVAMACPGSCAARISRKS